MSILQEQKLSKKYQLKRNPINPNLLDITLDNVARAEAIISSDSRYNNKKVEKSINALLPLIKYRKLLPSLNISNIFTEIVSSINITNSTRMSNPEVVSIVKYLLAHQSDLIERLYQRDFCLICELVSCSARKNYSFATKFCHYMCYYLFAGKKQQDNYSIYDNVIANILGDYAAQYGIYKYKTEPYSKKDFDIYKKYVIYSDVIDKILATIYPKISRNGFDHLLWYANK